MSQVQRAGTGGKAPQHTPRVRGRLSGQSAPQPFAHLPLQRGKLARQCGRSLSPGHTLSSGVPSTLKILCSVSISCAQVADARCASAQHPCS